MKWEVSEREAKEDILAILTILSIVMMAWGSLILPHALGLDTHEFNITEGIYLLSFGFIGFWLSMRQYKVLKETKWYESIKKKN